MKIRKFAAILFVVGMIVPACERDDICTEEITPRLIVRFYDKDNPDRFKSVQDLSVRIEGVEGDVEHETIQPSTDSISIPIRVDQDMTRFILAIPGQEEEDPANEDALELTYSQEDVFVSRSCGYKAIFLDVISTLQDDGNNWIQEAVNANTLQDITDENQAHVKIYH